MASEFVRMETGTRASVGRHRMPRLTDGVFQRSGLFPSVVACLILVPVSGSLHLLHLQQLDRALVNNPSILQLQLQLQVESSSSGLLDFSKNRTVERARGDGHFSRARPLSAAARGPDDGRLKKDVTFSNDPCRPACTSVLSCTSTLLSLPSHPSADLSPASTLHVTSRSTRIVKQGLQGPIVYMSREPAVCKQSTVPENCCQNPRWKKGVCPRREATTKKIPSLEGFGSRARSGHAGATVAFPTRSATRASAGTRLLLHHCVPFLNGGEEQRTRFPQRAPFSQPARPRPMPNGNSQTLNS